MINLHALRDIGEPWCVWGVDLTATETVLAIPKNSFRVPAGIQGGVRPFYGERVIILGFFADFLTAGAGVGFTLASRTQVPSPGGVTDMTIFTAVSSTTEVSKFVCVPECFIPLDAGFSSPSLQNGAQLVVKEVGAVTSGRLVIWGVTAPSQEALLTNRYLGSPFIGSAIPPTTP